MNFKVCFEATVTQEPIPSTIIGDCVVHLDISFIPRNKLLASAPDVEQINHTLAHIASRFADQLKHKIELDWNI